MEQGSRKRRRRSERRLTALTHQQRRRSRKTAGKEQHQRSTKVSAEQNAAAPSQHHRDARSPRIPPAWTSHLRNRTSRPQPERVHLDKPRKKRVPPDRRSRCPTRQPGCNHGGDKGKSSVSNGGRGYSGSGDDSAGGGYGRCGDEGGAPGNAQGRADGSSGRHGEGHLLLTPPRGRIEFSMCDISARMHCLAERRSKIGQTVAGK
ncbi:hypothetical protein HPB50_002030 [Hyalomma asiaticum]|uniref:Uncharacterized protein n=1 Tax=Hyalomma asiaticum TaxID=266040 RepID=A0ACB7T7I1_HYAAI|nr:hypothetical protein HPB50_002030 [Hyalomma asiaticum]